MGRPGRRAFGRGRSFSSIGADTRGKHMTMAPEDSARRLAAEHGLRFVDLSQAALAPGVATLVPEDVARQLHAVPIGRRLGTPVVAVSDPGNATAMEALRQSLGREFVAVVAGPEQVERAIAQLYSQLAPPRRRRRRRHRRRPRRCGPFREGKSAGWSNADSQRVATMARSGHPRPPAPTVDRSSPDTAAGARLGGSRGAQPWTRQPPNPATASAGPRAATDCWSSRRVWT